MDFSDDVAKELGTEFIGPRIPDNLHYKKWGNYLAGVSNALWYNNPNTEVWNTREHKSMRMRRSCYDAATLMPEEEWTEFHYRLLSLVKSGVDLAVPVDDILSVCWKTQTQSC